ncbi:DUF1045 domain-containing protein [Schauerella aestuarii]|uniref:DUF1045 domain-containing protein n=1 Tax=Schauerella aestuarii TaxID=2511204 RepID=UPI00136C8C28|nr:DUF1045 domain-containing protein [Achromobacter aestuarii]MYZ44691.1 DUF1045 domain-containing protein [Achromobacter aestuarii]
MTHPLAYRYAVYFRPPEPWGQIGRQWLGRCELTGAALDRLADAPAALDTWTRAPRRYGLHATLKAPFRLRDGASPLDIDRAMRALVATHERFEISLAVKRLRGFLAWCIQADAPGEARMNALAGDAVAALDAWRAPINDQERARRLASDLSAPQLAMLARWGYPYAFETFTFHISLTGHIDAAALEDAHERLVALSAPLIGVRVPVQAIAVYVQAEPDADFVVAREYDFAGTTREGAGNRYLPSVTGVRAA